MVTIESRAVRHLCYVALVLLAVTVCFRMFGWRLPTGTRTVFILGALVAVVVLLIVSLGFRKLGFYQKG